MSFRYFQTWSNWNLAELDGIHLKGIQVGHACRASRGKSVARKVPKLPLKKQNAWTEKNLLGLKERDGQCKED